MSFTEGVLGQIPAALILKEFPESKIVSKAGGDFNYDGKADSCFIVEQEKEHCKTRLLLIYFKRSGSSFTENLRAWNIFGSNRWGVQFQDPFHGMSGSNGKLNLQFITGGSGARQNFAYTFEYLHSNWFLVKEATEEYELPIDNNSEESITDFLKGETIIITYRGGKKTEKKEHFARKPLVRLVEFNPEKEIFELK